MHWDPNQDTVRFKYDTEVVGYHPYLKVAFSALGYLLFALVIVGSHKKGIFKNYAHTMFLILAYAFVIDICETGQTLYFSFNLPDENREVKLEMWPNSYNIVSLKTTVWTCTLSLWIILFHWLSVFVDAIVSIYHFTVRVCGNNARTSSLYSAFGIFLVIAMSYFASAFIFGEEIESSSGFGPVVCNRIYALHDYANLAGTLSCIAIAFITPIFPILTLIKGAAKKHNESGLTSFLLISSLPAASMFICTMLSSFVWRGRDVPKLLLAIVHGLFAFQQFRFPLLCLFATVVVPEIRSACFSAIHDAARFVLRRDISVSINVDMFHLKTGEKKHAEKTFTI